MFARLVVASLVARRVRLTLALLAVALGVAMAVALATLAAHVEGDVARTLRGAGPNFVILPRSAADADLPGVAAPRVGIMLPESTVAVIKRSYWRNNVLAAAPEVTIDARFDAPRVAAVAAALTGTWFRHAVPTEEGAWVTGVAALRPGWRLAGRWPREDAADEVVLGRDLAARLGCRVGERVGVAPANGAERGGSWTVTGIVAAGGLDDGRAWAPLPAARSLGAGTGFDRVWLSALVRPAPRTPPPDPARDPEAYERYRCAAYPANVAGELNERLALAAASPLAEVVGGEARVVGRLDRLVALLSLAAIVAAALGVLATSAAGVVERARELALLRSLGATRAAIGALLLGESILVALAGGVLGWVIGSTAAFAVRGGTFGAGAAPQLALLPLALALAVAIAVGGTLGPLRAASRIEPAVALRG